MGEEAHAVKALVGRARKEPLAAGEAIDAKSSKGFWLFSLLFFLACSLKDDGLLIAAGARGLS